MSHEWNLQIGYKGSHIDYKYWIYLIISGLYCKHITIVNRLYVTLQIVASLIIIIATLPKIKAKSKTKHIYSTGVNYGRHIQSSLTIVKIYL